MDIVEDLLSKNQFSRPGKALDDVGFIIIHYTADPMAGPKAIRDFFESLKTQDAADSVPDRSASAHEIIGLDGQILRALPLNEKAYHCGSTWYTPRAKKLFGTYCTNPKSSPNRITIGIELCHPDETGRILPETTKAAIERVRELCAIYSLDPLTRVLRHSDVTGKLCPLWYCHHPEDWRAFLDLVNAPEGGRK